MAKSKERHLLKHLQNATFRDERDRVILPNDDNNRLRPTHVVDPGHWSDAARIVADSAFFRTAWFPDANIAILDEAAPIWRELRRSSYGQRCESTIFTAVTLQELQEWLAQPNHHKERAEAIRNALENETWARKFGLKDNSPILCAILGYTRLLGLRRFLALPTPDGLTMVDSDPGNKCETMNAIGKKAGIRAQGLAKKGRIDAENSGKVNINDELHCLVAICYSLLTGRESVILTADEDFIEIFWKAQWFFDTHYRAFLASKLVKAGEFGKPTRVLKDTRGYFASPLTLYRRHSGQLREVLPIFHRSVPVSVIYVAPDRTIHKLGFMFECEMLEMLEMRSRTHGRCTDLFGEDNIHVHLGPLTDELDGLYFGIGRDAGDWVETNNTKTVLSRLDAEHALNCRERIATF